MTLRLEKRSETQPAVGAKRMKGRMMIAARVVLIILARRDIRRRADVLVGKDFRRHRHAQGDEHQLGGVVVQQNLNLHRHEGPKRTLHAEAAILEPPPRIPSF